MRFMAESLFQQIFLAQIAFAFGRVVPDGPGQVLADEDQLTPVLPAFSVALVGSAGAERNGKTDDETKDSEQKSVDSESVHVLTKKGNDCRPDRYNDEREDHLRQDGAVHPHKVRQFGVLGHVARTSLVLLASWERFICRSSLTK